MNDLQKCDELTERSKKDGDMIVGSEIRGAIGEARSRIAALEARNEVQRVHLEEQIERIAELEAKATADRKYMDEAEARIAKLEAEKEAL